jgi:hypothetical protein
LGIRLSLDIYSTKTNKSVFFYEFHTNEASIVALINLFEKQDPDSLQLDKEYDIPWFTYTSKKMKNPPVTVQDVLKAVDTGIVIDHAMNFECDYDKNTHTVIPLHLYDIHVAPLYAQIHNHIMNKWLMSTYYCFNQLLASGLVTLKHQVVTAGRDDQNVYMQPILTLKNGYYFTVSYS